MNAVATEAVPIERLDLRVGYAALGATFVQRLDPTPLPEPTLCAFNPDAAALIGLNGDEAGRPEFLRLAAGNARFSNVQPFAAVYAGHQFGHFVPQLGDGRAITLGEVTTPAGLPFEWQLKGAGPTAFSRFADGRAVLRSTIREYLCCEAMAALGVPTTRALAIAVSPQPVFRERVESAAVLTRLAPSHLRFGTFEYFHYRREFEAVKTLADYAIERFFPNVATVAAPERYAAFLREVVERTARMLAHWQAVGFAHGVMNTDNMSILGLTLDYGPFGFLDTYDAGFVCNHTDAAGRYAFDRQPTVALWNCHALSTALSTLVEKPEAESALNAFAPVFRAAYLSLLRGKFGLEMTHDDDASLFGACFDALQNGRVDYTRFFSALSTLGKESSPGDDALALMFENRSEWYDWQRRYRTRLASEPCEDASRATAMSAANPRYVLRNYLAQRAIEAAEGGDYSEVSRLADVLRRPFDERPDRDDYAAAPPESARHITVSCSS